MRGRPELFTRYEADSAIFRNNTQRFWLVVLVAAALVLPFGLPRDWMILLAQAFVAAIGVIGLNLVTGYAGQVSLGNAVYFGLGAYTSTLLLIKAGISPV